MHDRELTTTAFWIWGKDINPRSSGPYLCTIAKVELERKGDKSSRTVWCFTWGRFDNRPDDPENWIDFDEDGEWMIVAWAEMPTACDIGKRFIEDKLIKLERDKAERIICNPDSPMREIPLTKAQMIEETNAGNIGWICPVEPNELASMTIGEFVRIIKEIK